MAASLLRDVKRSARWFHALADETRLQIIACLTDGEQCVCDLTDMLDTGQSRLSFHLKTLKDAGIVTDRRDGRWVYYALNTEVIEEVDQFITSLKGHSRRLASSKCCD
jgi:ArsR family transcriptional regulator, arsenate/arsenite/antimonite-responsive transcriptional repressor